MAENQAYYYDQISHILSEKMLEEREMKWCVSNLKYQEEIIKREVKLKVQELNKLHLSLDKLSFANYAYRVIKPKSTSCLSVGELDSNKLKFLMQHGSKNIANEKKLLREINSSKKKKIRTTTIEELDVPIKKKNDEIENSHLYLYTTDFEGINEEMKRLEMVKQKAVANAAVGGKLWSSLGTKKDIQQVVNVMYEELDELRLKQIETRNETKYGEKKLRIVQKQILFLHKQLE
ncbi:uncharacterized protein LOC103489454 [Cucumis melo]|uniref:Uncharacterized protein LOC103489454 n=1 Tax=Cucumis melo TaxID=3656 RepID=A0ABM3KDW7_CUCME|nr:uncharacterized protein LOC103489454 [Cucumis melo]